MTLEHLILRVRYGISPTVSRYFLKIRRADEPFKMRINRQAFGATALGMAVSLALGHT
jgi:hypothetical protein